ncbi:MAG: co-chaperone GroES family protein [Patescibacteria group bacterium]
MIKPLPGYVLVLPIEDEVKTSSGLYTPEMDKDKPSRGKIIAITYNETAEKKEWFNTSIVEVLLKIGSTVIYKRFVNQDVEHEGKKYLLVNFSELLAIIE